MTCQRCHRRACCAVGATRVEPIGEHYRAPAYCTGTNAQAPLEALGVLTFAPFPEIVSEGSLMCLVQTGALELCAVCSGRI